MSTFEREMKSPSFKKKFEKEYKEFVLSEFICALMEKDEMSVRKLAKAANISPSIIQKIRSGEQADLKMKNFLNIVQEFGYKVILEKGDSRISL